MFRVSSSVSVAQVTVIMPSDLADYVVLRGYLGSRISPDVCEV